MESNETPQAYTITDWLQGKVAITISDETIASICFDRQVETTALAADCDEKTRDLTLADLYMFCATLPTSTATIDDKNGNWEHKEGSVTMSAADKKQYRKMAYWLYKKWGLVPPNMSSIQYKTQGMGLRRRCH